MPRVTSARDLPRTYDGLVQRHVPAAIHDKVAYHNAMDVVDALTSLPEMTPDQIKYLDTMTILVEAYERHHDAIPDVGPIEVLRHLMEAHDMNASGLGNLLGERSLGSKILNGDRELSKAHIRKLSDYFGLPADLFI